MDDYLAELLIQMNLEETASGAVLRYLEQTGAPRTGEKETGTGEAWSRTAAPWEAEARGIRPGDEAAETEHIRTVQLALEEQISTVAYGVGAMVPAASRGNSFDSGTVNFTVISEPAAEYQREWTPEGLSRVFQRDARRYS